MIRIAICDDDPSFLPVLTRMLTEAFAGRGHQIKVATFTDGTTLIEKIEQEKQLFDVVFLDVNMPVVHGFQVAQRLREYNAAFILLFTTYLENQSREGYRYGAFRYIFKNNLEMELKEAVTGILQKIDNSLSGQEKIIFKCRMSGVLDNVTLKKADIVYLKAEKSRRVTLKTVCAEYDLLVKPLSEYAKILGSPIFVPIMRNYLVNFNHVESLEGDVFVLTGGLTVPMGVKREVRKASMEKYLHYLRERL